MRCSVVIHWFADPVWKNFSMCFSNSPWQPTIWPAPNWSYCRVGYRGCECNNALFLCYDGWSVALARTHSHTRLYKQVLKQSSRGSLEVQFQSVSVLPVQKELTLQLCCVRCRGNPESWMWLMAYHRIGCTGYQLNHLHTSRLGHSLPSPEHNTFFHTLFWSTYWKSWFQTIKLISLNCQYDTI